ncbi:hypothetical protein C0Q70_00414 [Pomacea canaliculata]|uniref:Phosphorylated adapter RNA export protein n=1 Tax=Pomacea canaliculata TaxID=400727 RepID=A0A2T7PWK9_POMCA|nr:hypothetical protein C0Q70_00414 [Pomacea canaliculata]
MDWTGIQTFGGQGKSLQLPPALSAFLRASSAIAMSAVDLEELEEGEIAESDSAEKRSSSNPMHIPSKESEFRQNSDSQSDSQSDSDEEVWKKRRCLHLNASRDSNDKQPFVNPNYVKNGGMPKLPVPKKKDVWGSVLQEQILTQEVGGFSMEKRSKSDDLFDEVIDLEEASNKLQAQKRKRPVKERLSNKLTKQRPRRGLHNIKPSSTVDEVTYAIAKALKEKKIHLIRKVVEVIGQTKALHLLEETEEKEADGGMLTMNGSRRRTPGGVYLQLLKQQPDVTKEQIDKIFEEENRWFLENKKRKKIRARQRKHQQKIQNTVLKGEMDVEPAVSNCSENQASGGTGHDSGEDDVDTNRNYSDDECSADSNASFSKQLQTVIKQQAKLRSETNRQTDDDLDDVLDIEAEEDCIE